MIDSVSHTTRTASAAIPALKARCTAFTQVSAGSTAEGPSAPQPWNPREMRFGHQRSAEYSPVLPACAPSRRPPQRRTHDRSRQHVRQRRGTPGTLAPSPRRRRHPSSDHRDPDPRRLPLPFRPFPALAIAMAGHVLSAWEVRMFQVERAKRGERIRFFTAAGGEPGRAFRACTVFDPELGTQRVVELCGHAFCSNEAPASPGSRCRPPRRSSTGRLRPGLLAARGRRSRQVGRARPRRSHRDGGAGRARDPRRCAHGPGGPRERDPPLDGARAR